MEVETGNLLADQTTQEMQWMLQNCRPATGCSQQCLFDSGMYILSS